MLPVVFGQWTHDFGVFADEGGVLALGLDEVLDQFVQEAGGGAGLTAFDLVRVVCVVVCVVVVVCVWGGARLPMSHNT